MAFQPTRAAAIVCAGTLVVSHASAQTISPLGTGQYTIGYCVSGDGNVAGGIVGGGTVADTGFRWTSAGGLSSLGSLSGISYNSSAQALSNTGTVAVGFSNSFNGYRAFRWVVGGGSMANLGVISGGFNSWAYAVSDDGSVIAGSSGYNAAGNTRVVRWTDSGSTMTVIGTLTGGTSGVAYGLSADGSVMVGSSGSSAGERAFRWTQAQGMVSLGVLAGAPVSRAFAVNADGSVVVGYSGTTAFPLVGRAFRWTATGMESLGALPGTDYSTAWAVSGDGSIVVGAGVSDAFQSRAAAWTSSLGFVDLNVLLPTVGVDLTGWTLYEAYGISRDGSTIVGSGRLGTTTRGWIVRGLPRSLFVPCRPDFNTSGGLEVQDIFDFINAWLAGDPRADFDGMAGLSVQDIFDFLNAWLAGC